MSKKRAPAKSAVFMLTGSTGYDSGLIWYRVRLTAAVCDDSVSLDTDDKDASKSVFSGVSFLRRTAEDVYTADNVAAAIRNDKGSSTFFFARDLNLSDDLLSAKESETVTTESTSNAVKTAIG